MTIERERLLRVQACAAMRLRKTSRILSEYYNKAMLASGLHANQYALLVGPYLKPGMTFSELARILALDRTTLARNLRILQRRGLIAIQPGEDLRMRTIRLTDRGQNAMRKALPLWEEAQRRVTAAFGEAKVARLFGYLDELERFTETPAQV